MNTNSYNILYVDDEKENLTSFKLLFRKDFNVIIANSAQEGLSVLKEEDIQVIISDQRMPFMSGIEFLEHVSEKQPNIIRILLTGYGDTSAMQVAIDNGTVSRILSKPFDRDEMKVVLTSALEQYEHNDRR
ncbi:MAG: response regulator [Leptospiraceae bacterium]|nr:response regulator [Leptospiraceae bacterium]MBK9502329.1 response regulator [Leptospiraceae bacterium]MBL0263055.1 response regulator [Leptospiraceae bacterium]MBP9162300.1 response regulator [Leptospiraceae bacterium]